jgi:hypothetical protein
MALRIVDGLTRSMYLFAYRTRESTSQHLEDQLSAVLDGDRF